MKKQIGFVGVDSGSVWVGDPCYVIGEDSSFSPKSWADYCKILEDENYWSSENSFIEPLGSEIGIHIQTRYGDGSYPVFGEFDRDGRLTGFSVDFDYEENDEKY